MTPARTASGEISHCWLLRKYYWPCSARAQTDRRRVEEEDVYNGTGPKSKPRLRLITKAGAGRTQVQSPGWAGNSDGRLIDCEKEPEDKETPAAPSSVAQNASQQNKQTPWLPCRFMCGAEAFIFIFIAHKHKIHSQIKVRTKSTVQPQRHDRNSVHFLIVLIAHRR